MGYDSLSAGFPVQSQAPYSGNCRQMWYCMEEYGQYHTLPQIIPPTGFSCRNTDNNLPDHSTNDILKYPVRSGSVFLIRWSAALHAHSPADAFSSLFPDSCDPESSLTSLLPAQCWPPVDFHISEWSHWWLWSSAIQNVLLPGLWYHLR